MLKLQDDSSINRLLVKNHDDSLYFKTLYKVLESIKKQLCHELSQETVGTLTQLGIECVTPFGARTPFLVFNTPRDLTELAKAIPAPLSLKQLSTNTYRITCYIKGSLMDCGINCDELLIEAFA